MLLNDVRILENIEIISEAKSPQGMKIRGLFQRADEENNNNRIYPLTVLESQVKGLQDMINENRLCGELDHPSHDIVKLSNASHLITGLYMKGNDVIGEAKVLDTPAGKVAQALIEGGVKIGISSRGVGTLSEDTMRKVKYVNEDYKLVTFDLVADPSTKGAFPALSESTEGGERTRKIVNDTYKKALGEKVFVTLLKEGFEKSLDEADKPYENDESSYDEIMKMRGYPSIDDVLKRGNIKDDPFYKAAMSAVKGATPVRAKEDTSQAGIRKARKAAATAGKAGLATQQVHGFGQHFGTRPAGAVPSSREARRLRDKASAANKETFGAEEGGHLEPGVDASTEGVGLKRKAAFAQHTSDLAQAQRDKAARVVGRVARRGRRVGRKGAARDARRQDANTQPTYGRMAQFLAEITQKEVNRRVANQTRMRTGQARTATAAHTASQKARTGAEGELQFQAGRLNRAGSAESPIDRSDRGRREAQPQRSKKPGILRTIKRAIFNRPRPGSIHTGTPTPKERAIGDAQAKDAARVAKSPVGAVERGQGNVARAAQSADAAKMADRAAGFAAGKSGKVAAAKASDASRVEKIMARMKDPARRARVSRAGRRQKAADQAKSREAGLQDMLKSDDAKKAAKDKALTSMFKSQPRVANANEPTATPTDTPRAEGGVEQDWQKKSRKARINRIRTNKPKGLWARLNTPIVNSNTQPTYGRMAELLGEAYLEEVKIPFTNKEVDLGAIPKAVGRGAKKVARGVKKGIKKGIDKVAKITDPNPKYPTGSQYPHGDRDQFYG